MRKYWKIKFDYLGKQEIIDDYYNNINKEKEQEIYQAYLVMREKGITPITCNSKLETSNEVCGCELAIRKTVSLGYYELARLPHHYHHYECSSENEVFKTEEIINEISPERLLKLIKRKKDKNFFIGSIIKGDFHPSFIINKNKENVQPEIKIRQKQKVLNLKETLDYIFKRDQINDKKDYAISRFEKEYWQNCYNFTSNKKTTNRSIRPSENKLFKWNWKYLPKIYQDTHGQYYINMLIHNIFIDLSKKEINKKKGLFSAAFEMQQKKLFKKINDPIILKIYLPDKESYIKIRKLKNNKSKNYSLSLLTTSKITHNIKNSSDLDTFNFEDIKLESIKSLAQELIVIYDANNYKNLDEY